MTSDLKHMLQTSVRVAVLLFVLAYSSAAPACPNCKLANEADSNRPRAYMYSILFMIGMPATIFTGFGISFYRMTKKASLQQDAVPQDVDSPDVQN